nr:hypothetical protein [Streptomyces hoynatensis]
MLLPGVSVLARYALGSKAPLLERAQEPKRTAMLTAVMRHLEAKAIDEALDVFQVLMATRLPNTAKRKTAKERLSTLPQLQKASRHRALGGAGARAGCPRHAPSAWPPWSIPATRR